MGELTTDIALLDSEVRSATNVTDDVRSARDDKALMFFLDITKAPAASATTLTFVLEAKDPVSGKYVPVTSYEASKKGEELGAGTTLVFIVGSASAETKDVAAVQSQALALPRTWRAKVVHSAGGNWTYTLGYESC